MGQLNLKAFSCTISGSRGVGVRCRVWKVKPPKVDHDFTGLEKKKVEF